MANQNTQVFITKSLQMRKLNQIKCVNNKNKQETEATTTPFLACDETTHNIKIIYYFKLYMIQLCQQICSLYMRSDNSGINYQ